MWLFVQLLWLKGCIVGVTVCAPGSRRSLCVRRTIHVSREWLQVNCILVPMCADSSAVAEEVPARTCHPFVLEKSLSICFGQHCATPQRLGLFMPSCSLGNMVGQVLLCALEELWLWACAIQQAVVCLVQTSAFVMLVILS